MASITVTFDGAEETHSLDAPTVTLGRGVECDIRLADPKVSRRQCQIVRATDGYKVVDLGSTGGTVVNGNRIGTEQRLKSGDRIQAGGTVVVFTGDPVRSPVATPAAATAGRAKTDRIARALPEREGRTTDRIGNGARGASNGRPVLPDLGTPSGKKSTTNNIPKTTRAGRKATDRISTRRPPIVPRKKKNPLVVAGVIVGIVLVLFTAALMIQPEERTSIVATVRNQIEAKVKEGRAAEGVNDYPRAIQLYRDAIKLCEPHPEFQGQIRTLGNDIDQCEKNSRDVDAANNRFIAFKVEFDKSPRTRDILDLRREAGELKKDFENSGLAWVKDLQRMIEVLNREIATNKKIEEQSNFQNRRNSIIAKHKLDDKDGSLLGAAILEWKNEFLPKADDDGRRKAENEIKGLEGKATELLARTKNKANRLATDESKSSALAHCREILKRLDGSQAGEELKAFLKTFE